MVEVAVTVGLVPEDMEGLVPVPAVTAEVGQEVTVAVALEDMVVPEIAVVVVVMAEVVLVQVVTVEVVMVLEVLVVVAITELAVGMEAVWVVEEVAMVEQEV